MLRGRAPEKITSRIFCKTQQLNPTTPFGTQYFRTVSFKLRGKKKKNNTEIIGTSRYIPRARSVPKVGTPPGLVLPSHPETRLLVLKTCWHLARLLDEQPAFSVRSKKCTATTLCENLRVKNSSISFAKIH